MTKAERLALHSTRIARTSFCATCIKSRDPTASRKSTYGSGLSLLFALGFSLSRTRPRTSYLADWPTPAIMLSLVLMILFVHIAIYLINTIGASTVDLLLWQLYLKVPTSTSRNAREQQRLKGEVMKLKREMNSTSSQDEFAKWAKLRRRHDKALEEFEAMNQTISTQKSSFDWAVKLARWLSTNGLKMFLQFWYSKTPVFALPEGWFPYYVEWILSFPRAPLGSVSINVWNTVCASAVAAIAEILGAVLVRVIGQKQVANEAKKTQ